MSQSNIGKSQGNSSKLANSGAKTRSEELD